MKVRERTHDRKRATASSPPAAQVVVLPEGIEVDCANADEVFDPLEASARTGGAHLILDARGVTFLDSMGLARLVRLSQACRLAERLLVVIPSSYLRRLLEVTGLTVWLTIADDETQARALLPGEEMSGGAAAAAAEG